MSLYILTMYIYIYMLPYYAHAFFSLMGSTESYLTHNAVSDVLFILINQECIHVGEKHISLYITMLSTYECMSRVEIEIQRNWNYRNVRVWKPPLNM